MGMVAVLALACVPTVDGLKWGLYWKDRSTQLPPCTREQDCGVRQVGPLAYHRFNLSTPEGGRGGEQIRLRHRCLYFFGVCDLGGAIVWVIRLRSAICLP